MRNFVINYTEKVRGRKQEVCYTIKAETKEAASAEFEYLLMSGVIDNFFDGFTVSELY